jgi:hypothetical protein
MVAGKVADAVAVLRDLRCWRLLDRYMDAAELAAAAGADLDAMLSVLRVLTKAGFLECQGMRFRLTPEARALDDFIEIELRLREITSKAGGLSAGLRGRLFDPLDDLEDTAFFRSYAGAMRSNARPLALALMRLSAPKADVRILDLGGADGTMAAEFLVRYKGATATIVDRRALRAPCAATVESYGLQRRLKFVVADIETPSSYAALVERHDMIVLANVAHLVSRETLRAILLAVYEIARPGTQLLIYDMFVSTDGPVDIADLLSLDWVAGGIAFHEPVEKIAAMVAGLGFAAEPHRHLPLLPGGLIVATR